MLYEWKYRLDLYYSMLTVSLNKTRSEKKKNKWENFYGTHLTFALKGKNVPNSRPIALSIRLIFGVSQLFRHPTNTSNVGVLNRGIIVPIVEFAVNIDFPSDDRNDYIMQSEASGKEFSYSSKGLQKSRNGKNRKRHIQNGLGWSDSSSERCFQASLVLSSYLIPRLFHWTTLSREMIQSCTNK